MRSRVDRARLERALRGAGIAALALWIALALWPRAGTVGRAGTDSLAGGLSQWTRAEPVTAVEVAVDTVPDAVNLAWLAALRASGVPVRWTPASVDPLAVELYPVANPAGGTIVATSDHGDRSRVLRDALGPLDTARGGVVRLAAVEGALSVRSSRQRASVVPPAAARAGRVYVAGTADWESKFVIAALEESGWDVDARLAVGPGHEVLQGSPAALDTTRYAAAVLLDSAAAQRTRGLERFARSGGGVVLAGDASRAASVSALAPWRALAREVAPLGNSAEDTTWRGLSRVPFVPEADRALVLERRGANATLLARRHGAGRVLALGYDQSWRWRMTGGDRAVAGHREWWSRVVSSVALRPEHVIAGAAPLARLYESLGEPSRLSATPDWLRREILAAILGAIALVALVTEWWLRRSRGGA